jgi:hypothetical protein
MSSKWVRSHFGSSLSSLRISCVLGEHPYFPPTFAMGCKYLRHRTECPYGCDGVRYVCHHFARTRACRFGVRCNKHHKIQPGTQQRSRPAAKAIPRPRAVNGQLSDALRIMNIADINALTEPILTSLYRILARETHPDKILSSTPTAQEKEVATEAFRKLNSAYEYLRNHMNQ